MKIISGGQTGVDVAALDAAMESGLEYGGSLPRGRLTENGPLPARYRKMRELSSPQYPVRTEQNVKDAAATLIFSRGKPESGTALTIGMARKHKKPYLHIDLAARRDVEIIDEVRDWLVETNPAVLNVAGNRESKAPGIYRRVYNLLRQIL